MCNLVKFTISGKQTQLKMGKLLMNLLRIRHEYIIKALVDYIKKTVIINSDEWPYSLNGTQNL